MSAILAHNKIDALVIHFLHCLIWIHEIPKSFRIADGTNPKFWNAMRAFFEIGDMITRVMGHHRRGKIIVIPIIKPTMGFSWNGTNCRSLPGQFSLIRA